MVLEQFKWKTLILLLAEIADCVKKPLPLIYIWMFMNRLSSTLV